MDKYLTRTGEPIIPSLLYLDLYKLTMVKFYLNNFPTVQARYELKVRSDFEFAPYIDEINNQLDMLCELKFTYDEIVYLKTIKYFTPNFIDQMRGFSLNREYVHAYIDENGKFQCYSEGPLVQASLFEIYVLAILQEIRSREAMTDLDFEKGNKILSSNIKHVKTFVKYKPFKFIDFSCRRAVSVRWLHHVLSRLTTELSNRNFIGTSCVYYAKMFNIDVSGSIAHEAMMLGQSLSPTESQEHILRLWADEYKGELGIALSDTFGAKYFIKKVFHKGLALQYTGVRHDSGDPIQFGEDIIDMYRSYGIDPMHKTIVFSDGLTFEKAFKLCEHFNGRINVSFGIGTNLGNAVGVPALQIVMKMVEADGKPVIKISDSPGKGMCNNVAYQTYIQEHINKVVGESV